MGIVPLKARQASADEPTEGLGLAEIIDVQGSVVLVCRSGCQERLIARLALVGAAMPADPQDLIGWTVLVLQQPDMPDRPVIVARVHDGLPALDGELRMRADRVLLEARQQLELRCGDASVVLRADGQLVSLGTRVTSRASETHKIRGATVLIN